MPKLTLNAFDVEVIVFTILPVISKILTVALLILMLKFKLSTTGFGYTLTVTSSNSFTDVTIEMSFAPLGKILYSSKK
mgnify:CR=1 FL=1